MTQIANPFKIEPVTDGNFEKVIPLIGQYQKFYRQVPDEARNRRFFGQFVGGHHPQATLFLALGDRGEAVGFATLYFLPSSLTARTVCMLNDLYTVPEARGKGIARSLVEHCRDHGRRRGFSSLDWQTEQSNSSAQRLYDKLGASRSSWYYYSLPSGTA